MYSFISSFSMQCTNNRREMERDIVLKIQGLHITKGEIYRVCKEALSRRQISY